MKKSVPVVQSKKSHFVSRQAHSRPSRPAHLRQANAQGLLRLLREHGPCSKADLVRLSGLSAPTVSSNIAHLEGLDLIESLGGGTSSGGRPPALLKFNSGHGYIAGADIGGSRLRMILADLDGTVLGNWSTVLSKAGKTPEAVCQLISDGLRAMCESIGVSVKKVLHLTAGAPGATRADEGIVIAAPNLAGWNDLPLRAMLQKKLNIPVVVENDTNLAAVGERWRGAADGANDFVFIALGTGFGAGIFINGQLYYGSRWTSGEVGYLGIGGEVRQPLNFHKAGQLESVIGGEGIEIQWRKLLQEDGLEKDKDLMKLHSSEVFDLAGEGDQRAQKVLQYTAKLVAEAVGDITVILDPKIVVLGGGVGSHPQLCQATKAVLEKYNFAMPEIRSSALGTQAQLFGSLSVSMTAVEASLLA